MRTFTASTLTAASMFPFVVGSGAPRDGVCVGRHLVWGERVHVDPFAWLAAGLTTNTGMFQLGQPGTGKSAFAKRQLLGLARDRGTTGRPRRPQGGVHTRLWSTWAGR